jgi:acyl transferase domain-containing protein
MLILPRHLEGASGILGMVKAILMLENDIILPTAGFEKINPRIVDKEKIRVADVAIPWPSGETKRAIVTNFGTHTRALDLVRHIC